MLEMYPKARWVREMIESGVRREHFVEWIPGSPTWKTVGEWAWQITATNLSLRGLPGGRFISTKPDGYTILSFD
jgi:hypothetical protein